MNKRKRTTEFDYPDLSRPIVREIHLKPVAAPKAPRILTLDVETSPLEVYCWKIWEETVGIDQIKVDWTILSYAAKWLGKREAIYADAGGRGADKVRDDDGLLDGLWHLMNEADIVVAQNGIRFDIRKINYRLIRAGYTPYSPIRVIDTMVQAKRLFASTSNKLGWLSEKLTNTPKSKHKKFPGFELWLECLKDNPAAWAEMKKYNVQDIRATEKLYLRLRPWIPNHPNVSTYDLRAGGVCPKCGSPKLKQEGRVTLQATVYAKYRCLSCGAWSRGKLQLTDIDTRRSKLA